MSARSGEAGDGEAGRRFRFRYGWWRPLLSVLGLGPMFSSLVLRDARLRVRMGWAFHADIPLAYVTSVTRGPKRWGGIGVHGWRGYWLVNGSVTDIVRVEIDPARDVRALVIGARVRLQLLEVSVVDPDDFVAQLGAAMIGPG
jgi:hypothetical protein